jgi:hypothetical protein
MDASAMADIVRELANIAAGAFKRVADTEGWAMTMGLPTEPPPAERAARPPGMSREFWCRVAGTSAEVHCRLFVTPKVLEHLPPAELTEGMVLAQDVLSDQGTLLFPSGTRLSETTILRLHQLLPATSVIEIARAA